MCTCGDRGVVDVKVDMQCSGLSEYVANLRFELGVKGSAAEAELVLFVLRMLNSGSCIKEARTVSIWAGWHQSRSLRTALSCHTSAPLSFF